MVGIGERRQVISHAFSQSSRSPSTRIRITSGTQRAGWVSLIWMTAFSGRLSSDGLVRQVDLTMFCREAETKKYCCFQPQALALDVVVGG